MEVVLNTTVDCLLRREREEEDWSFPTGFTWAER